MARDPTPTWFFVLVVVRRDNRFLVVHETKHGQLWYLPAGRVEPGETFVAAAERETLEETGISVAVDGVIRIEHSPGPGGTARVRVILSAHPASDHPPKTTPDDESLEARWVTLAELSELPLRGTEVRELFEYVNRGAMIAPTWFLTGEDAPYPISAGVQAKAAVRLKK